MKYLVVILIALSVMSCGNDYGTNPETTTEPYMVVNFKTDGALVSMSARKVTYDAENLFLIIYRTDNKVSVINNFPDSLKYFDIEVKK